MTVGELRKALEGVDDKMEIVLRTENGDKETFCGDVTSAGVEFAHDENDTPFFAIDGNEE